MHFGNKMKYTTHDPAIPDLRAAALPPAVKSSASQPRLRRPPALSSHPRPFDPDELTRKLYGVLAEQQAYAERKRRARAAIEAEREARHAAQARANARHAEAHTAAAPEPTSPQPLQDRRPGAPVLKLQTGEPTTTGGKSRHKSLRKLFGASPTNEEGTTPTYHHVPQVAASQFARTTRGEPLSPKALVHEYSRRTLNGRPEDHSAVSDAAVDMSYLNRIKVLRRSQSLKEGHRDTQDAPRFSRRLDATAETDEHLPQRELTQENLCDLLKSQGSDRGSKNMTDVFQRIVASLEPHAERPGSSSSRPPKSPTSQVSPTDMKPMPNHLETVASDSNEHRVDWTQSDEMQNHSAQAAAQPPLRKADSRWALKSRLSSFSKHKGDRQSGSPIDEKVKEASITSPKSPLKLGFFSRFKR